jgi:hypothetical protein
MNAMLEPRIVAARIQGRTFPAHGASGARALIKDSSHGCLISNWMPGSDEWIPIAFHAHVSNGNMTALTSKLSQSK